MIGISRSVNACISASALADESHASSKISISCSERALAVGMGGQRSDGRQTYSIITSAMKRLPLDVPIPIHLTPREVFALDALLADAVTFDRLETCLAAGGLVEDACEDAAEHVSDVLRRAINAAADRAPARRVQPRVHVRCVTDTGCVVVGGVVYRHELLDGLEGSMVRCRYTEVEGAQACEVSSLRGQHLCVALAIRQTGGRALAA